MFRIGQKVVTVSRPDLYDPSAPRITKRFPGGVVVTIRDIDFRGVERGIHPAATIRLEEAVHDVMNTILGTWEPGYDIRCFRPIVEKKTDAGMAILQEILRRETVDDRAPAVAND